MSLDESQVLPPDPNSAHGITFFCGPHWLPVRRSACHATHRAIDVAHPLQLARRTGGLGRPMLILREPKKWMNRQDCSIGHIGLQPNSDGPRSDGLQQKVDEQAVWFRLSGLPTTPGIFIFKFMLHGSPSAHVLISNGHLSFFFVVLLWLHVGHFHLRPLSPPSSTLS